MRKPGFVKNLLAAVGAAFVALLVLSVLVAVVTGGEGGFGDKVAVVTIEGLIADSTETTRLLGELARRDDVKAVVLRINSPGGGVGPSQEIHREVQKLKQKKKVVASMGALAASGGYYIASAAHMIVANPGTITGSIGVIIEFVNARELLARIGLKGVVIKSGPFKDAGSPVREMTDEEKRLLQAVVDDVHSQFVDAVAEGRGLERAEVEKLADGRIFSGLQAKALGLVDRLGNLSDAVRLGSELAGISGEPSVIYPDRRLGGLWRALLGDGASALARYLGFGGGGLRILYLMGRHNSFGVG
ncbi:MAG TPA: signal peptide peptidase SppA [Deltaproteobacteria bacterium]|nr:signal peptide peptidase SppA [Deltaproteobacteria bacterium]